MDGLKDDRTMWIATTRFGDIEIDDSRVLVFGKGLLGFTGCTDFVLLEAGEDSGKQGPQFWWMQSTQAPDVAFVVTDPSWFVSTYRVPMQPQQMADLAIGAVEDAQVLVIVNKRGNVLTGNLQGPIVVNLHTKQAEQLVLSDRRYTTRVPLAELPVEEQAGTPVAMAG
jgi:flagellar assembly factor FliW